MYGGYGGGPGYGGGGYGGPNGYGGGHDDYESRSEERGGWIPPAPPHDSGGGIFLLIAASVVGVIIVVIIVAVIGVVSDHNEAKWEADPTHDSAACAIFTPHDYASVVGQRPSSVTPESNQMDDPLDLSGPDDRCSYYQNNPSTPKMSIVLRCGSTAQSDRNDPVYANAITPQGELIEVYVDGSTSMQAAVLRRAYEAELSKQLCPYGKQYPS